MPASLPEPPAVPAPAGGVDEQNAAPNLAPGEAKPGDTVPTEELRLLLDRANEAEKRRQEMTHLVCRAISLLSERRGETWVQKAGLRPFIQRMDPTFHESNFGFETFSELLESMGAAIEMRRGEHDHEIRIAQAPSSNPA
jgi:hypothetical protein